jgi:pimeloyl-ACP methyl ester carboxylesterase
VSTFVLIHGAWYGGWCWTRVAQRITEAGHQVFTPTLTGLGDRADLFSPEVDLRTHVDDVVGVVLDNDLEAVVLVGHSYGGLVVREAADRVARRIKELVLIDAWAGEDGASMDSLAPDFFKAWIDASTIDGRIAIPPARTVGVVDPEQAAWVEERLTPQPRRTFSQPTRLSGAVDAIPCRAILSTPGGPMPFGTWAKEFGWPITEIASGHDVMTLAPDELAGNLLGRPVD